MHVGVLLRRSHAVKTKGDVMTRQEIRNIARKRLGETTAAFWTDAELNTYINLGCKNIAWRTKCLRDTGYINVASCEANTSAEVSTEWAISTYLPNYFAINEVYFKREGTTYRRLEPSSREELDIESEEWQSLVGYTFTDGGGTIHYNYESETSEPLKYYWSREEDVIGIYPPPNDEHDGAPLKIYYSKDHINMTSDTQSPTLPTNLHLAAIDYTVASGLEDRGWAERANDFWNKYIKKLQDYEVEKGNEREDEEIIMKNYRNVM